ncbi:BZ3500_MvSof-1268-A1-R1_Chr1-2g01331 [Microbotryum saponariae]|uniref:BZ3500_MvSof-1268-A1-R1_Chr1-2g01331 protein n=1 Tax=Microbotryum saponariae TaxID=289078 RepID=A0A2X0KXF4_9BASI|nr:BZ3500_MvSof-1268-A1-R1_Chr1-2g01331 [Microbotryum saponariae]SCZ97118.1 BZ3501_MvSof-1269-A2-R1_Chr1-2g00930 [Microbotryum saponariae]
MSVASTSHLAPEHAPLPLESRSLLVVHATVTGTASDVAERIARRGVRAGWHTSVKHVSQFEKQTELLELGLIVFVVPTTGNGAAPPSFLPLWTSLLHPELPQDFLQDLRQYNWAGKKLSRRLDNLGATAVVERGEADDQNVWGVESTFPSWLERFYQAIDPLFAPAPHFKPLSIDDVPPPRIRLTKVNPNHEHAVSSEEALPWANDARWAKVVEIKRTTPEDWFQDVRKLEVEFVKDELAKWDDEAIRYSAGDVLEIRPQNSPEDVDRFLSSAGWTELAHQPFRLEAHNNNRPLPSHFPQSFITTLHYLLTYELDISGVPRLSFFEWLAHFSEGDMKEKLQFFCTGEGQDDLNDYTLRPRRTINEVMYEFRSANVPIEYILDLLPPLRPRAFSIASTPEAHQGHVELLIAIVKYKTNMSMPRKGVCTSWLAGREVGDRMWVRFDRSGLLRSPVEKGRPLIMVGPGTGVAPFRALMEERIREGAKDNMLFFGCRSLAKDFHFQVEFTQMRDQGFLKLITAASRDQEDKIYVQHLIPSQSALIWDWIHERRGSIYICGSSTNMPKSVKKAFLQVFIQNQRDGDGEGEGEGSDKENEDETRRVDQKAEAWWETLEKEGRIVEETWG